MTKQAKIIIETDSLLIVRNGNFERAWCAECAAEVEMIAVEKAEVISNLEPSRLQDWLQSHAIHRSEGADGSALICLSSLLARVRKPETRWPRGLRLRDEFKEER